MKGGGAENRVKSGGELGGKGGSREKYVKALGGSDMTKKMVLQGGSVGYDGDSAVGKRGGSSTMASYFLKKKRIKYMGSSLVKGDCSCNLQASCFRNQLHAWRHHN